LRRSLIASIVVTVAAISTISAGLSLPATAAADTPSRPNVIVIQTDDQTVADLDYMPNVRKLARNGVTFDQMVTPFAICCPSRAAQLSGAYPHNNGVQGNFPPDGGFVPWEQNSGDKQIGKWLQDDGYRTVHIGKYINGYAYPNRADATVPQGWSQWRGSADPSTYQMWGYRLNGNTPQESKQYGNFRVENPANYSTDVYRGLALDAIRDQKSAASPYYMQVAFLAPHVETVPLRNGFVPQDWADVDDPDPDTGIETISPRPAPRHRNAFPNMPLAKDPSFNEADVSDKGPFIRDLPVLSSDQIAELKKANRQRRQSLLAVDEGVGEIVRTLRSTGQYDNTVIVFMGDNGYMLGQHRISKGKYFPYEPSLRIPFIVSGPGIRKNAHVPDLVSLIDYAPTMLTLTGAQPSGRTPDGVSLEPLLRDSGDVTRRSVLLSSGPQRGPNGTMLPQFDGVRSPHYSWWRYEDGFEEMYDLRRDPFQLTNVASKPAYANKRNKLIAEWERLRDCQGATCQVRAPGAI